MKSDDISVVGPVHNNLDCYTLVCLSEKWRKIYVICLSNSSQLVAVLRLLTIVAIWVQL